MVVIKINTFGAYFPNFDTFKNEMNKFETDSVMDSDSFIYKYIFSQFGKMTFLLGIRDRNLASTFEKWSSVKNVWVKLLTEKKKPILDLINTKSTTQVFLGDIGDSDEQINKYLDSGNSNVLTPDLLTSINRIVRLPLIYESIKETFFPLFFTIGNDDEDPAVIEELSTNDILKTSEGEGLGNNQEEINIDKETRIERLENNPTSSNTSHIEKTSDEEGLGNNQEEINIDKESRIAQDRSDINDLKIKTNKILIEPDNTVSFTEDGTKNLGRLSMRNGITALHSVGPMYLETNSTEHQVHTYNLTFDSGNANANPIGEDDDYATVKWVKDNTGGGGGSSNVLFQSIIRNANDIYNGLPVGSNEVAAYAYIADNHTIVYHNADLFQNRVQVARDIYSVIAFPAKVGEESSTYGVVFEFIGFDYQAAHSGNSNFENFSWEIRKYRFDNLQLVETFEITRQLTWSACKTINIDSGFFDEETRRGTGYYYEMFAKYKGGDLAHQRYRPTYGYIKITAYLHNEVK